MCDELPTDTQLYIFLEIFILLLLFHFSDSVAHLFGGAFDKVEESLDIHVAHYFDIEYLID